MNKWMAYLSGTDDYMLSFFLYDRHQVSDGFNMQSGETRVYMNTCNLLTYDDGN